MSHRMSARAIVIKDNAVLVMKRNKFGMEYYTLVGGGVEIGEEPEHALRRELHEEASLQAGAVRLVFMEDGGMYGTQYIYLCEYMGGEPAVRPDTIEASLNAAGQNTYTVMWLPLDQLPLVSFRSTSVRDALVAGLQNGFPETAQALAWQPESVTK